MKTNNSRCQHLLVFQLPIPYNPASLHFVPALGRKDRKRRDDTIVRCMVTKRNSWTLWTIRIIGMGGSAVNHLNDETTDVGFCIVVIVLVFDG